MTAEVVHNHPGSRNRARLRWPLNQAPILRHLRGPPTHLGSSCILCVASCERPGSSVPPVINENATKVSATRHARTTFLARLAMKRGMPILRADHPQ